MSTSDQNSDGAFYIHNLPIFFDDEESLGVDQNNTIPGFQGQSNPLLGSPGNHYPHAQGGAHGPVQAQFSQEIHYSQRYDPSVNYFTHQNDYFNHQHGPSVHCFDHQYDPLINYFDQRAMSNTSIPHHTAIIPGNHPLASSNEEHRAIISDANISVAMDRPLKPMWTTGGQLYEHQGHPSGQRQPNGSHCEPSPSKDQGEPGPSASENSEAAPLASEKPLVGYNFPTDSVPQDQMPTAQAQQQGEDNAALRVEAIQTPHRATTAVGTGTNSGRPQFQSGVVQTQQGESLSPVISRDTQTDQPNGAIQPVSPNNQPGATNTPAYVPKYRSYAAMSRAKATIFECPKNDPSIPRNDEDKCALVIRLVNAIMDTSNLVDDKIPKRWQPNANFYHLESFEILAWELVEATTWLHLHGWEESVHDRGFLANLKKYKNLTFGQRITQIEDVLRFSKSTCETLLKGEKLFSVIGMPRQFRNRVKTNKTQNNKRALIIKAGRGVVEPPKGEDNGAGRKRTRSEADEEDATDAGTDTDSQGTNTAASKPTAAPPASTTGTSRPTKRPRVAGGRAQKKK